MRKNKEGAEDPINQIAKLGQIRVDDAYGSLSSLYMYLLRSLYKHFEVAFTYCAQLSLRICYTNLFVCHVNMVPGSYLTLSDLTG